jgi:hypothetical protein
MTTAGSGTSGRFRELIERFGPARHPERPVARTRPDGATDELVDAVGLVSEALETVEDARGHLYAFHRLSGHADLKLQEAVRALREAGEAELAAQVDEVLVGRDIIPGLWTFQLVEAYDDSYWSVFTAVERAVRTELVGDQRHLYEAEMKDREQREGTGD